MKLLNISIYTDGACSGNPGPGGWAALLLIKSSKGSDVVKKEKLTIKGGEKNTTNNRMELTAAIEALNFVKKNLKDYKVQIKLYSDSSYIVDSINGQELVGLPGKVKRRVDEWQENGWMTKASTPIANQDLWKKLIKLDNLLSVSFYKVKGHSTNKFNNYVDEIAVKERDKYKAILKDL